jgi:uncharacterized membrane protein (DUF4010 family)
MTPMNDWLHDYGSLAVALGIGFAVGLQRAQSAAADQAAAGPDAKVSGQIGGIRTFPLVALTGAVASLLGAPFGAWLVFVGALCIMAPVAIAYGNDVAMRGRRGITTEIAILLTYLLGALAAAPVLSADPEARWLLAATLGICATAILSLKRPLHDIAARISQEDLYAWLKFAVVAIVIVPLLPDREFGPTEELRVLNPQKLGSMVVLIAAIGLVGYIAMRMLGPHRGLGITGLVGGLVSSTAVTLALSHRSKRDESVAEACALGVILANTIMPMRVLIVASLIDRGLFPYLAAPLLAMAGAGVLFGIAARARVRHSARGTEGAPVDLANPFELGPAIKFGALFAVILLISKLAAIHLGDLGLYVAGLIAGITDIAAITLSMAQMAGSDGTAFSTASATILLAAASNTLFKATIALSAGSPKFRGKIGVAFGVMALAGVAGLALVGD